MKKILATMLLACVIVCGTLLLSSCEQNEFTSMIPGLNATMEKVEDFTHRHRIVFVEQVDATCTEAGVAAHYACKGCEMLFADEKGESVITSPDLIEKLAHVYSAEKENVAATCTTDGYVIKTCACGAEQNTAFTAIGHVYDNDTDATCNNCTYERCLHTQTEAIAEETESTCSVAGMTAGVKCSKCGEIIEPQQQKELKDHNVVNDDPVPAGCLTTGLTAGTHCDVCGTQIDKQSEVKATGHSIEDGACSTCGAVIFEAEKAALVTDIDRVGQGLQSGKTLEDVNYPSGGGYVYYLSDTGKATLTFTVNSSKAGNAVISFCMGLSGKYTASQLFTLTVNGTECEYYETAIFPEYSSVGATRYFGWYEVEVADVSLIEGVNTIVLTKNTNGINFDYIALRSTDGATISEPVCTGGHSYGAWEITEAPTYEAAGKAVRKCENCPETEEADLPIVSADNGYEKLASESTYEYDVWQYSSDNCEVKVEIYLLSSYEFTILDNDPFIAENGGFFVAASDPEENIDTNKNNNKYGTYYQYTKGATFTMTVTAENATTVNFIIMGCSTDKKTFNYSDAYTSVKLNGNDVTANEGTFTTAGWSTEDAVEVRIATLNLTQGENTITFTVGTQTAKRINIASIVIESAAEITLGTEQ